MDEDAMLEDCKFEVFHNWVEWQKEHDAKCAKRIAKRMAVAKRILEPKLYEALVEELEEIEGAFDAFFTREKRGIPQEACNDFAELEVFVDQWTVHEDCYHGFVYFQITKTHWLAFEYDC